MVIPTRHSTGSGCRRYLLSTVTQFGKPFWFPAFGFTIAFLWILLHESPIDSSLGGSNLVLGDVTATFAKVGEDSTTLLPQSVRTVEAAVPPKIESVSSSNSTQWRPSHDTTHEVCFVTSVYASSLKNSDRPPDIRDIRDANPTFAFYAFTNLKGLDAPGWTIVEKNFTNYKRYITQSRWAKFMGWKHELVNQCQAVFYMDGFCGPKLKHSDRYKRLAKAIHDSEYGLFQNQHEVAEGPLDELDRVLDRNKDIAKNVKATKKYLMAQPDFRSNATLYANHYIGYDPKNIKFQEAAEFFWSIYSLETLSWRDQPLWAYCLDRYQIHPTRLGTFQALFKEYYKRMGHSGHRYNEKADTDAVV